MTVTVGMHSWRLRNRSLHQVGGVQPAAPVDVIADFPMSNDAEHDVCSFVPHSMRARTLMSSTTTLAPSIPLLPE